MDWSNFYCFRAFLLIGSIIATANDNRICSEPIFGAYFLSGGLATLFAGYIGQSIDDIRNSLKDKN